MSADSHSCSRRLRRAIPAFVWLLILPLVATEAVRAIAPFEPDSDFIHETWGVADGLSGNSVFALAQTPDGYLWAGTEDGLSRFDGSRFVNLPLDPSSPAATTRVSDLLVDQAGTLWIGTSDGLWRLHAGRFSRVECAGLTAKANIQRLRQDTRGAVWIATSGELVHWGTAKCEAYALGEDRVDRQELLWMELGNGDTPMLVVGDGPIRRLEGDRLVEAAAARDGDRPAESLIFRDRRGCIWASAKLGLRLVEGPPVCSAAPAAPHETVVYASGASDGGMWLNTIEQGFGHIGLHRRFLFPKGDALARAVVLSALEDRDGATWFGVAGGGLHRVARSRFLAVGQREGLTSRLINAVIRRSTGELVVGTHGEGVKIERPGGWESIGPPRLGQSLVYALYEGFDKELWVGTSHGVWRLRGATWRHFGTAEGLPSDFVSSIAKFERHIWVVAGGAGAYYDPGSDTFRSAPELAGRRVANLLTMPQGGLRLSSDQGLLSLEPDSAGVLRSATGPLTALSLGSDGSIWAASLDQGLVRIQDGRFRRFTKRDGLLSDSIRLAIDDCHGRLWICSGRGLASVPIADFDRAEHEPSAQLRLSEYSPRDGYLGGACNGLSGSGAWRDTDGRLWFATTEGLAGVAPNDATRIPTPVQPLVEEVRVDGSVVDASSAGGATVRLLADSSRLTISFSAPAFDGPRPAFRFQLRGFDSDWVTPTGRDAVYSQLPPGRYDFDLQARTSGPWRGLSIPLEIAVLPHLYQRRSIQAVAVALVALAVVLATHLRSRSYRRRAQYLERLVRERTHELEQADVIRKRLIADVAHELRTPLTRMRAQLEAFRDGLMGRERVWASMESDVAVLAQLVSDLLDLALADAGRLRMERTDLDLATLLTDLVARHGATALRLRVSIDFICPAGLVVIADPIRLAQAVSNLLDNALRWSPPRASVELRVERSDSEIRIAVTDHGPGIARVHLPRIFDRFYRVDQARARADRGGAGIGLAIVDALVRAHGGRVTVDSEPGLGSCFAIFLPADPRR